MKPTLIILASTLILCALAFAYDMHAGPQFVPTLQSEDSPALERIPPFTFTTLDGTEHRIEDLKGKPTLIHFWATWCAPCLTEMPELLGLIKEYNGQITLLAISSDHAQEDITKFITQQSSETKEILNSKQIYMVHDKDRTITHNIFLTTQYPETIILAANGSITHKIIGPFNWKTKSIKDTLNALIIPSENSNKTQTLH